MIGAAYHPVLANRRFAVSIGAFALAGLVYGPYPALAYTLLQDRTPAPGLTGMLALRGR
jgi:hypothetical protein